MGHRTGKLHTPPMRRCIACMESKPKAELLRIARTGNGLAPDPENMLPGRGVYLCRSTECIQTAKKKNALKRAFRTGFDKETLEALFEQIEEINNEN